MNLGELKMPELRNYAKSIGVQPQQHESRESLVTRIAMLTYPDTTKPAPPKENIPVAAAIFHDENAILEKLAPHIKKGVTITINNEDKTWHATYRGAEDSGSMSMSLNTIYRHVELFVSRGALMPRKIQTGELAGALAL